MKFRVMMKDPDGPYECIREAAEESLASMNLDDEDREAILPNRVRKLEECTDEWLKYGEYVELEFDTEEKTCTVVKPG